VLSLLSQTQQFKSKLFTMAPRRKSGAKPPAANGGADVPAVPADDGVDGPVTFVTEGLDMLLASN